MRLDWLRDHISEVNPHNLTLENLLPASTLEDIGKVLTLGPTKDLLGKEVIWSPNQSVEKTTVCFLKEDFPVLGNTFQVSPLVANLDKESPYFIEVFFHYTTNSETPVFTFGGSGLSPIMGHVASLSGTSLLSTQYTSQAQVVTFPVADGTVAWGEAKFILYTGSIFSDIYVALASLTAGGTNSLLANSCLRYHKLT